MSHSTPGLLFLFHGPRIGWLRRELLPAIVLAVEPTGETVHLSLLCDEGPEDAPLEVEIGLLPMEAGAFERSVAEDLGRKEVGTYWWQALQDWRRLAQEKQTGGFSVSIWEARNLAWQTVRESHPAASPKDYYLEYAWPFAPEPEMQLRNVQVVGKAKK